ncbi:MAG: hypothetical protein GY696_07700 [Gammaproteobacteria bacterium]|nr:hypothetical protein [Gammaproteobacteria bacterium]
MKYLQTTTTVKKLAALNAAIDKEKGEPQVTMGSFFSKMGEKKTKGTSSSTEKPNKKWFPSKGQCFGCLQIGYRVSDCPSRKKGVKAKQRPDGSFFKPKGGHNGGDSGDSSPPPQSFQAFSFNVEAKPKVAEWLVDSGCNKHLTPFKGDLAGLKESTIECTFGNNEVRKVKGTGDVTVEGHSDRGENVKIILHDVLYVPGLPQRLLSTGQLRRVGGGFVESDITDSMLIMPD